MTTMSSKSLHGASSSSPEADYLRLSADSVYDLVQLVSQGLQLNERQCQDLSSKLVLTVENVQKMVGPSYQVLKVPLELALKDLYKVLEKAKLLVHQCCATDWCRAAVFQIHNEWAFQEVLQEVNFCYSVIYEETKRTEQDWIRPRIQAQDLCQSSLFLPAHENEITEDRETLKRKLEQVVGTPADRNSYLAKYLLEKLEYTCAGRINKDFKLLDASLCMWMNETEPQETWKLQRVIGGGSGAICVCSYEWLGIPCARKEFHCRVTDLIFRKEVAILAQLNHPNIAKFFCCGSDLKTGHYFIAMELMEMSLNSLIESRAKTGRAFPILLVLDIMTQIARGVYYLHGLHIAHRDLKPLNVVVTETHAAYVEDFFCVKLVDFGMSKTKVQVSKSNTISIPGVGTTKYRAPEVFPQAQGVAHDRKGKVNWFLADAYSFGITCAVLLSLEEPFASVPASQLFEELLQGVRPKLPGECPEALVSLLRDCWATDPQSRPGFAEICSRLEQCKLQEVLRVSSEDLQEIVGSDCIETVSVKQYDEQFVCATGVEYVQSQCASTVSFIADDAEEGVGVLQFHEGNPSIVDYSQDHSNIILSELEPKKRVGLWSQTMSNLAQVMSRDALLFKKFRYQRSARFKLQQKCLEFDVKPNLFPYEELRVATRDFHETMELVNTSTGPLYKGVLPNGNVVAVKKYSRDGFHHGGVVDLLSNEVAFSSKMKHKNLLTLKGCCLHDEHWLVVYEYVENFTLSDILLDKGPYWHLVPWPLRLKICLGVAEGLHYLHELARPRIVHGNITAKTVFLDKNFEPKIGDFCWAEVYPSIEELSKKVDVYNFGLLCLGIISGRCNYESTAPPDQKSLLEWAWLLLETNRLLELVDPTLHLTDVEVPDVQRAIKVSLRCLQDRPATRPSMAKVVSILQRMCK